MSTGKRRNILFADTAGERKNMEKNYPINMFEAMAEMSVCEFVIPKEITTDRLLGFEYAFRNFGINSRISVSNALFKCGISNTAWQTYK